MPALKPRQPVPTLNVDTLAGESWKLSEQQPEQFTLVNFYRGLHCPKCKLALAELNRKTKDFNDIGVGVIAVSCDDKARALRTQQEWSLDNLPIGYGLGIDKARTWGLYISSGIGTSSLGVEEPALFCEPGLFLVRADNTLYFAAVQTMPFARPHYADVLQAVQFVIEKDYPARGEQ